MIKLKDFFYKINFIYICFVLLILFVAISNIIWLKIDEVPQRRDESIHLNASSSFAETIKTNPINLFKTFITQESYYPPLIPLIGAFFGVFYPEQDNFTYSMILFNIILILFTFLLAKQLFNDSYISFCASIIICSFPLIYTEGHFFMFDLPLTAATTATIYFLLKTEYFSEKNTPMSFL